MGLIPRRFSSKVVPGLRRAVKAQALWLEELNEQRQNWSEWKKLTEMVNSDYFQLLRFPDIDGYYMVGENLYRGRHLIYNHTFVRDREGFPDFLPSYLIPLYDLKLVQPLKSRREMCRMSGGIASCLKSESLEDMRTEDPGRYDRVTLYADPAMDYGELFTFQITPYGQYFYVNRELEVVVYSLKDASFKKIARLSNFIRYCLYFFVNGMDWYLDGYTKNVDTTYFDVFHIKGV